MEQPIPRLRRREEAMNEFTNNEEILSRMSGDSQPLLTVTGVAPWAKSCKMP